jgi:hypothetical protein
VSLTTVIVFPLLQHLSKNVYPLKPSNEPLINKINLYFFSNKEKNYFFSDFDNNILESILPSTL